MSILTRIKNIFTPKAKTSEQEWIDAILAADGSLSSSGITVNAELALKTTAVYSCVKLISTQIAQLPLCVYKTVDNKGRLRDKSHIVDRLIHTQFNEYTCSFYGMRPVLINLLLTGFGYIMVNRRNGQPNELWPVNTNRVTKEINSKGKPRYIVDLGKDSQGLNERITVSYTDMVELQGLSPDAVSTYDPIKLLADAVGLLKAAESYSAKYFENGVQPSGVVEVPNAMSNEAYKRFEKSVNKAHAGLGNRHKLMLLEEGAKFNRIAAPPQEGQTIEARKFQIIEVARFFNVPPSKIMDYERATWGNMEEVNAQFLNDCLMEYIKPIEQIFTMQLLTEKERSEGYYIEYNLSSLLRGKMTERYTSYSQARQWGWLSVNEIREKENMSNIGTQGDIYLTPGNMLDSKEVEDAKTNAE